jgi:hypothetical protein
MFTKEAFVPGQDVEFNYHDKLRMGTVDRVYDGHVCVKVAGFDPDPAATFKSFKYNKMSKAELVTLVVAQ